MTRVIWQLIQVCVRTECASTLIKLLLLKSNGTTFPSCCILFYSVTGNKSIIVCVKYGKLQWEPDKTRHNSINSVQNWSLDLERSLCKRGESHGFQNNRSPFCLVPHLLILFMVVYLSWILQSYTNPSQ